MPLEASRHFIFAAAIELHISIEMYSLPLQVQINLSYFSTRSHSLLECGCTWIPIWTLNKNAAPVFSCQNFCTMHTRNKQAKGRGRTVEQLDKPTIEQASEKQERRGKKNRTQIHQIVDGFVLRDRPFNVGQQQLLLFFFFFNISLCVESNSSGRPEHSRRRYFHCLVCETERETFDHLHTTTRVTSSGGSIDTNSSRNCR